MQQAPQTLDRHDLWAGVDLKLDHARFHLEGMNHALRRPEPSAQNPVLHAAAGANIDENRDWQRAFFAHLDAFLSAARSVPVIIRCCFGVDDATRQMKDWFDALALAEQDHRRKFEEQFKTLYESFGRPLLVTARHISEHRTGFPPVTVTVSGRFGVTYIGDPIKRIPITETRRLEGEFGFMESPLRIHPRWTDFEINGQPLFDACNSYVQQLERLIQQARTLAQEIHDGSTLSAPPNGM
jgi:hypothetical protein